MVLFPVLAWQTKLLLDVEPDVQRRLALVAVGDPRRVYVAGLLAAALAGLAVVAVALVLPWVLGGVTGPQRAGDPPLAEGMLLGVWAHLLAAPAAVALGAVASRAVARTARTGVAVLVGGSVVALVLGLRESVIPWVAPPLMATARATAAGPTGSTVALLTLHALVWTAVVTAGYARLRRHRP